MAKVSKEYARAFLKGFKMGLSVKEALETVRSKIKKDKKKRKGASKISRAMKKYWKKRKAGKKAK